MNYKATHHYIYRGLPETGVSRTFPTLQAAQEWTTSNVGNWKIEAIPQRVHCDDCNGTGRIGDEKWCPVCDGLGSKVEEAL